jgi:tetratricopeptide (TPR) repeat protein
MNGNRQKANAAETISDTNISDTNISDTNISDTNISDTNISDTNISDTNISDTNIHGDAAIERSALLDERDQLLRAIDDLDREHAAGDIDDADYQTLTDSYTARTAHVLRQLNDEPTVATPLVKVNQKPRWIGWAAYGLIGTFAIGAGILVARSAGERIGNTGLTGTVRSASNTQQDTIDALLTTARNSLASDPFKALKAFDEVHKLDPQNVEAVTYGGWLVRNVGRSATDETQRKELLDSAIRRLEDAIKLDPTYPDALAFRGIIFLRDQNDPKSAVVVFDALDKLNPPNQIKQLIGSAEQEARDAVK